MNHEHDVRPSEHPAAAGDLALPKTARQLGLFLGALLVMGVLFVLAGTYRRIENELEHTLHTKLQTLLDANVRAARQWLSDQGEVVQRLAGQPLLAQAVRRFVLAAQPEARAAARQELLRSFQALRDAGFIDQIHLLSPEGKELLSSAPPLPDLDPRLLERLRSGSAVVVAPELLATAQPGHVLALAPIGAPANPTAVLGVLVDRGRMSRGIQVARWGQSGETYAFAADGSFLTEPRFVPSPGTAAPVRFAALRDLARRIRAHDQPTLVAQYDSYRKRRVVGAATWLEDYGFGIATEVSRQEALGSLSVLRSSFITLVALLAAALVGFLAVGRWTLSMRQKSLLAEQRLGRLARAIQPLSAALENDPSAVLLVDDEGVVAYANASSHRVLRYGKPLVGTRVVEAFAHLDAELQAALDSGHDSIVAQASDRDDETLLVSARALKIAGRTHFLYMLRPVTRQVRKKEVENYRKLIRVLSHELNNSLAPVRSLVTSARVYNEKTHQDSKLDKIFETITGRISHLVAFLESYRGIARLPQPDPRLTDWNAFVDAVRAQMEFTVPEPIPAEPGYFDPIQFERVLINLIKNAHEAGSSPEHIELRVQQDESGSRIEVTDRGSGMPDKVLKQAMLPFFSTKDSGSGIGLALSREIVEAHGGHFLIANREGGGLSVTISLPSEPPPLSQGSLSRLKAIRYPL